MTLPPSRVRSQKITYFQEKKDAVRDAWRRANYAKLYYFFLGGSGWIQGDMVKNLENIMYIFDKYFIQV